MIAYIDNTGLLRISDAKIKSLDGTTTLLTEPATFTIYDSEGSEVIGQVWPANMTLSEPGNYAGLLESDVEFLPNRSYTAVITAGTAPNARAVFNVDLYPEKRGAE